MASVFTIFDQQLFEKTKSICIGGYETKKYITDRDIFTGNLTELAEKLLECSGFFGIDRGMSHLSGTLGLVGDVIIQAKYEDFFDNVKKSYNFMYPTLTMHSKASLNKNNSII